MDSDTIVVLRSGQLVECGPPHELMAKEDGIFREMATVETS